MFIQACMTIFDKQRVYAKNSKHMMSGRGRVKVLTFSLINRNAKWAFRKNRHGHPLCHNDKRKGQ